MRETAQQEETKNSRGEEKKNQKVFNFGSETVNRAALLNDIHDMIPTGFTLSIHNISLV